MKRCVQCGSELQDGMKFCNHCGAEQTAGGAQASPKAGAGAVCPNCGKPLDPGVKFCRQCGTRVAEVPVDQKIDPRRVRKAADPNPSKKTGRKAEPNVSPKKSGKTGAAGTSGSRGGFPWRILLFGLLTILVIALIGVAVYLLFGRGDDVDDTTAAVERTRTEQDESREESAGAESDSRESAPGAVESGEESTEAAGAPAATTAAESAVEGTSAAAKYGKKIRVNGTYSATSSSGDSLFLGGTEALKDGDVATAWAEGVAGDGAGEMITINLDQATLVYGIGIVPGCQINETTFAEYGAPSSLRVSAGDRVMDIAVENDVSKVDAGHFLLDVYDFEGGPVKASQVTISVAEVKPGTRFPDTCISELYLYTYSQNEAGAATEDPAFSKSTAATTAAATEAPTTVTAAPPAPAATSGSGDYIFPNSASEYLTAAQVSSLDQETLQYAINEIYARRGYIFTKDKNKNYFGAKSWYRGTIADKDAVEAQFNKFEKANVDFLASYRK